MDYSKEVHRVAINTLRLMDGENKWRLPIAFSIAFRGSPLFELDPELRHSIWNGVKRLFRSWKEKAKEREIAVLLIGAQEMSEEACEFECPLH